MALILRVLWISIGRQGFFAYSATAVYYFSRTSRYCFHRGR